MNENKFIPYEDQSREQWTLVLKELEEVREAHQEFQKILQQQDIKIDLLSQQVEDSGNKIQQSVIELNQANYSFLSGLRTKLLLSAGIGLVTATPVGLILGAKMALGTFCFSSITSLFY